MTTTEIKHYSPLAAAPPKAGSENGTPTQLMSYTCQTCAKRKVRCDRRVPCAVCSKSHVECIYLAPAPRRKKRKLEGDVNERLQRYESILLSHGLLKDAQDGSPEASPSNEQLSLRLNERETARIGTLLSNSGKTRYIDSNLWRQLGDEEMHQMTEDDEEDHANDQATQYMADPLTGALAGKSRSLVDLHPPFEIAMELWSFYVSYVDPICRILHTPSVEPAFREAAKSPRDVSKNTECLLFTVYHFAVTTMDEDACMAMFNESRSAVLARYRYATCQALVNASFLRSAEISILQSYVLFLLSARLHYDPHTFWILTGVAFRMGQRLGIHRDGESLGLPPFEIQMRRRLFWQLLPMDGIAAQITGTGISPSPESWDTKPIMNVNEDQIWPGMTHQPEAQTGATDMIFCLARTEVGRFHNKTKAVLLIPAKHADSPEFGEAESAELEERIKEMEDNLETKIVRYCDVVEPLHLLTISMCRGAMTVIRLRLKINLARHHKMSESQMREVYRLAMKTVDYELAAYENLSLRRYSWHFKALFQHSALACLLTTMRHADFLTPQEIRTSWTKLEKVYGNHPELFQRRALHVAIGRLTIKAWKASAHLAGLTHEPSFVQKFRVLTQASKQSDASTELNTTQDQISAFTSPESGDTLTELSDFNNAFSMDPISMDNNNDWLYWDKLMSDYHIGAIPTGTNGAQT